VLVVSDRDDEARRVREWHSIRRKWATERKGYPVGDVMEAGGWKNNGADGPVIVLPPASSRDGGV